jgi:hypothetical protein
MIGIRAVEKEEILGIYWGVRLSGNRDHCHNAASSHYGTKRGRTGKDNTAAPRIPDTDR